MMNTPPRRAHKTHLTPREHAVLSLLARGRPNKEIADELGIAMQTVKMHLHHAFSKLDATNRTEAAMRYAQLAHESRNGKTRDGTTPGI